MRPPLVTIILSVAAAPHPAPCGGAFADVCRQRNCISPQWQRGDCLLVGHSKTPILAHLLANFEIERTYLAHFEIVKA